LSQAKKLNTTNIRKYLYTIVMLLYLFQQY
jgi:hypothetical protein